MKRRDFIKSVATIAAAGVTLETIGAEISSGFNTLLPQRTLGKTGVSVSALALGGVIGMQLPPSADHDPVAIAEAALDLGITYFDTAPSYNKGQSEKNYGHMLARRRKEVFLACKTGDRTYDGTMRSVEQSLKNLQTDHLDLLQVHGLGSKEDLPSWDKPTGVLTALRKLRDQKVTHFIGITGHDNAAILRQALEMYEFDTLLSTFNPVSRRQPFREDLLPAANRKQMGIIAMKVMGGGNGCLVAGNPFKTRLQTYHDETEHQVKPEQLIRYALGLPVSVAVIGVASVAQLKTNIAIVQNAKPMDLTERRQLEAQIA